MPDGPDPGVEVNAMVDAPVLFNQRAGLSLRQRVRMTDSYGLLLILVLAAILSTGLAGNRPWVRLIPVTIQGAMLLFAQRTSMASRRLLVPTVVFAIVAEVGVVVASAQGATPAGNGTSAIVGGLLVAATVVVVVRRLLEHPVVSGVTILGAVCVYLLVGLFFSYLYGTIGYFGNGFFKGAPDTSVSDLLYFSYVTLTTVGYGDLVAGTRLGQMTAVCEALLGQIYLVTVVALLVSRVGFRRPPRGST